MKIKSLLLGSAAATMAVTSANAADVFIPEPEVVEYVRVCEAAGSGFFYIPGTETCLRIHGYIRYDIGFGELNSVTDADGHETWNKRARASFRVSTWADTELGPLRTYIETRWQYDTNGGQNERAGTNPANPNWVLGPNGYRNAGEFSINFAYIDLAGLRIGKDESYFTTFTGYAGSVINDTTAGGYGPFDTNLMSYTFSNGGFSAGISLEQGSSNYWTDADFDNVYGTHVGWGIDDYVPHVVVGAGYDSGAFQIRGVFAYDTRNNTIIPDGGATSFQGGWAAKVRGDVSFDPFSAFVMLMYGENSSAYTTWANGAATAETFSVIGGASFDVNDQVALNGQVQWAEGNGIGDEWAIAANVNYEPVDGLIVRPEVVYYNNNAGQDIFGGTLRFQRSY